MPSIRAEEQELTHIGMGNMWFRLFFVASVILTWLLIVFSSDKLDPQSASAWAGSRKADKRISYDQLMKAMDLSVTYLARNCHGDGKFEYRINMNPDIRVKQRYNLLRHAGAIYALASYEQAYPKRTTQNTLKRATEFLKKFAIAPLPERDDLLAVWSHPELTGSQKPLQAKLGGTGLGLIALLSVEKVQPGTTSLEYLRRMGNFLLFMQKTDGGFISKYVPSKGGKDDSWVSLYYPGEAALGLLMLYEKDRSLKWLQAAADGIAHLARNRKGKKQVEADHWALLATARLLPLYQLCRQPLPKNDIEGHAIQICESILANKPAHYSTALYFGSFTDDGRTTPTSIRLEGLLAANDFLPTEHTGLRKRMLAAIDNGLAFLLNAQVRSGPYAGGMPRAVQELPKTHPHFDDSFNRRITEVRIDYVQHALSAMLQYERSFFDGL